MTLKRTLTTCGLLALLFLLFLGGCHAKSAARPAPSNARQITAMVLSDNHTIAPTLHDNGNSFDTYAANDGGADLKYSATILRAFVQQALKTKPDVVILSGDLTNNGERASHDYVAKQLKRLRTAHIQPYVVPGNHDINNPIARRFKGKQQFEVDGVSPEQFKKVYHQDGYAQAAETDSNSLSYLVKPGKKTWFLMLNSAIYRGNYQQGSATVGGGLNDGTLKWVKQVGQRAKKQGATVIPVLHHNTMDHTMIHQDYTIGYADQVRDVFTKAGIKLSLSGHIHAQNITHQQVNGTRLTDIASGSLIIAPHYYGTLTVNQKSGQARYHATRLNVSDYIQTHQGKTAAATYRKYDHDVLYASGYNAALAQLYEGRGESNLSTAKMKRLADGMGRANIAMFRGTPIKDAKLLDEWQAMPKDTPFRSFILRTNSLKNNLNWRGATR
ncbi:metallophosphoesterase family protein [Lactiplantibacillus plajomi]|uniref:metallophosphoesterase family protein n=1 Tax=Lactiplantibacillus plajomi TaxID=1457217 RepID=UPI001CDD69F1|nr:metallophosphoesterase [Lactiplantibacillus plajomi]